MIMKKFVYALITLLSVGAVTQVQAQDIHPRVEVAGNFSTHIVNNAKGLSVKDYKMRSGFRVAGAVEFGLLGPLYFAPGLAFQQNGSKVGDRVATLNYLSVPVNLGLRAGLGNVVAISVEAGPSFSYGISSESSFHDVLKNLENEGFRRFETGVNASVALSLSSFYVRLGSDIGLTNIYKKKVNAESLKNASFYLGVGLRF